MLNGSWTIVTVNIIKTHVPSFSLFWVHCTTDHSFAMQTQKITEKSGEIYSWFTVMTSLASVLCSTCTPQPKSHHSHMFRGVLEHNALASRQFLRYAHLTLRHISNSCFHTLTPDPLSEKVFPLLCWYWYLSQVLSYENRCSNNTQLQWWVYMNRIDIVLLVGSI